METKETVIIKCLAELVDHNRGMIEFCKEGEQGEALTNYYEGKFDAYSRVLELLQDIERIQ